MELKNIFKMTKTDRYTQDGRDELAKLQETEDVKYKTGDISQKTGLQKQPDGSWAPPKKGGKPAAKEEKELKPSKRPDQKKNPLINNPDVLGMTANGARKRMEAFGAQFVENKNGKDYFKTTSGDLVEVEYGDNKKVLSKTSYTGGEKPEQAYPSTQGHDMQSYMSKLREEGWENQGWERNASNEARGIYKKGDKTIRVMQNWNGTLGGVTEIKPEVESKPAEVSPSDIAIKLDEIASSKGGTKNIGGVKVTYVPGNGYRVTHKAPNGTEITTGYDSIEEAHQAVKFRLNRIKKGEIPAISEAAESKPAETSWKESKVGLTNQANVPLSLNSITFGMTPAWAEKHGYKREDVNGTAAEVKLAKQIITNQDWSNPEEAVKNINDLGFGYTNWKVTEKQEDKVKIASKDSLGNIREMTIKRPQAASDSAPRILTGDTKIRIKK